MAAELQKQRERDSNDFREAGEVNKG